MNPLFRQPLIRLLLVNLAGGIGAAALMLGGLLLLNPGGLRDLMLRDEMGVLALGMLAFGLVITFGSVAMGTAIMSLGADEGSGQGRRDRLDTPAAATAAGKTRPRRH
ncbi:MAG TPA: hypothetical protein VHA55_12870 [Pseudorhodoplanes sp.]|nr:hypothetical protein [Pseudorhodoplanes sp.]